MKKNTHNKEAEKRKLTYEEGMALLRKVLTIEKENGSVTEKEKEYWAKPENLKVLVEEFRYEKTIKYKHIWSLSFKCLVAVLLLTLFFSLAPFLQYYKVMLLKGLIYVCIGAIVCTSIVIYSWMVEGASGKYTFKMWMTLLLWLGIMFLISFVMNPLALFS